MTRNLNLFALMMQCVAEFTISVHNPLETVGISHRYHLEEPLSFIGGSGMSIHFYFIFRSKSCKQIE